MHSLLHLFIKNNHSFIHPPKAPSAISTWMVWTRALMVPSMRSRFHSPKLFLPSVTAFSPTKWTVKLCQGITAIRFGELKVACYFIRGGRGWPRAACCLISEVGGRVVLRFKFHGHTWFGELSNCNMIQIWVDELCYSRRIYESLGNSFVIS